MDRRAFVSAVAFSLLAAPLAAKAEPAGKVPRVTVVWIAAAPAVTSMHDAFRQGLRERGWVEGQTVAVDRGAPMARPGVSPTS